MQYELFLPSLVRQLRAENVILCFRGPISQNLLLSLGKGLKLKIDTNDVNLTTASKVFSVFVEQIQNILNYSAEAIEVPDLGMPDLKLGILLVGQQDDSFFVSSGNAIYKSKVDRIRDKLDAIIKIHDDKEALKQQYKMARKKTQGVDPESKGAGLGFIEMARKASSIEYSIEDYDGDLAYFTIKVVI